MHFERGREPMTALRYYAQAAEAALLHLSPAQCMTLTERALTLLDQAPEGAERKALEIALATLRGVAATQLLGVGSEAKSALERAYSLLRDVPGHPMRSRLLYALGLLLCLRGEYAEALAVAQRAEALSSETNDPVLMLAAGIVHADVDQLQGRSHAARAWVERGLALAELRNLAPAEAFVADPEVMLLGLLAVPLLHLGLVEQGRTRLQRAHARARELGQPMAGLAAIWYNALFEVRLGNAERVAALADEMRALVDDFALGVGRNGYRWFRGWADARMGQPLKGYRGIREGYEESARLGMLSGGSEVLGYAAEALVLAGDWVAAQHQLDQALQVANTQAERVYLPQLFLIQAEIARARGQSAAADASARQAVAEARAQEAPWLELIALLELCECNGGNAEDRQALAALVKQLPEASDTIAVTRARALLGDTKAA
jgi:ATP/maltotriose-dependent transcriptional regulator MalT